MPNKRKRRRSARYHIKYFDKEFKAMLRSGIEFELIRTTYSRRLTNNEEQYHFDNKTDEFKAVLNLINVVRREANEWLKAGGTIRETPIDYFNLLRTPTDEVMAKIDLRSAYWRYALLNNIITEETDRQLKAIFEDCPVEDYKNARTKILGSLATRKTVQLYAGGQPVGDPEIITQPTRPIYIEICRGVDDLMKECASEIEGCVYYYYDCMFVSYKFSDEVIDFFRKKQYDVSVEETKLEFFKIGEVGYLVSTADDKMYVTRRENRHLLDGLDLDNVL